MAVEYKKDAKTSSLPTSLDLFSPGWYDLLAHLRVFHNLFIVSSALLRQADNTIVMAEEQHVEQDFLEFVVKSIVNHSEDVVVDRTVDERGVLLTLHVNQEDMGYVIGREGQTARALRILLKIVGAKANARVNMKIFEPENARREHQERKTTMPEVAAAPHAHGEAGLVTDSDLSDLGI